MGRPRNFNEEDVVNQAMDVFWAKGYRRTTPRDLMDATGLSKSSLYATFGSKQGLFLRAIDRYASSQLAGLRAMLSAPDLRTALVLMYEHLIALSAGDAGRSCMVCTTAIEASEPVVAERVAASRRAVLALLVGRLEQAQRAGQLGADRDLPALALLLFNNNMGLVVMARSGASAGELRQVAGQVIRAVCG